MGTLVAEEIVAAGASAAGASLAGGVCLGTDTPAHGARRYAMIADLAADADVIIDFTHAAAVQPYAAALAEARCAWVLGTTGLTAADQDAVARTAATICVIQAANFSPGVNTVLAIARLFGAMLPAESYDAEILEMHHRQKRDAPSGTALAMGSAVAAGRNRALNEVHIPVRDGDAGPRPSGGIGFASLRGGQIVGEHSLILTAADEQIVLTHRAFDRRAFARGAVRAALWSAGKPPGLYGMADVLGMAGPS